MALISDLVKELAVSTGTAEKSITVIARWLREDGLLSQKGHGRGAARATPLDAARLLIALMVGGKSKNAPQAVRDFGQLVIMPEPDAKRRKTDVRAFLEPPNGSTFEDGLALLIESFGNGDVMHVMKNHRGTFTSGPVFSATLHDHLIRGSVAVGYAINTYAHPIQLRWLAGPEKQLDASGNDSPAAWRKFKARYESGIESQRNVSAELLRPLGEVVADLREPGSMQLPDELIPQSNDGGGDG